MRQDAAGTRAAVEAAFVRHGHNLSAIARETGVHRRTVQRHLQAMGVYGQKDIKPAGMILAEPVELVPPPTRGGVRRTIITYALNDSPVSPAAWQNLLALRDYWGAEQAAPSSVTERCRAWPRPQMSRRSSRLKGIRERIATP